MKCNSCGREIADNSNFCSYCGSCQNSYTEEELNLEDYPELFNCVECGRPLPVGIDKCIYCNHIYQKSYADRVKAEQHTGILGHKGLRCPMCQSDNIRVENDIPTSVTIKEILLFGMVMPTTKAHYRKDMIYHCASCGYSWTEE